VDTHATIAKPPLCQTNLPRDPDDYEVQHGGDYQESHSQEPGFPYQQPAIKIAVLANPFGEKNPAE